MSETIYFNGKKYGSVAEMPSRVRQMYEKLNRFAIDENQDGVPDIVQSGGLEGLKETVNMIKDVVKISNTEGFESGQLSLVRVTDSSIYINGKEFSSTAEMPDHIRQEYENIINNSQDGREDIFDESWRQIDREKYFNPHDDEILNQQSSKRVSTVDASIQTIDSTGRFIMIVAIAILIFGCLIAVWFLLF